MSGETRRGQWKILLLFLLAFFVCLIDQMSTNKASNEHPTWSPDGQRIAFSSYRRLGLHLCMVNPDGSNLTCIPTENITMSVDSPEWSPDGKHFAFTSDNKVCVMDVNGDNVRCLTDSALHATDPIWSPDGSQIAFQSLAGQGAIYIVDVGGSNLRHLVDITSEHRGYVQSIVWSPDGSQLAFRGDSQVVEGQSGQGMTGLYIIDVDGKNLRRVGTREGRGCLDSWSQDGKEIISCDYGCDATNVADGSTRRIVENAPGANSLSLFCSDLSPDQSQLVFEAMTIRNRSVSGDHEIYTRAVGDSSATRLTYWSIWDGLTVYVPLFPPIGEWF